MSIVVFYSTFDEVTGHYLDFVRDDEAGGIKIIVSSADEIIEQVFYLPPEAKQGLVKFALDTLIVPQVLS